MIQYPEESTRVMLKSLQKFALALVMVLDGELSGKSEKRKLHIRKAITCHWYLKK